MSSATDYYPFGMPMPGRSLTGSENYRYAFQGQEKDPETGKEAFQLRLWDGRIGRWLTTDPAKEFQSPYLGMGNNPVKFIDMKGDTTAVSGREGFLGIFGKKVDLYYDNGQYFNRNDNSLYSGKLLNTDGTYKGFLGKTATALQDLESQSFGNSIFDELSNSSTVFNIKRGANRYDKDTNTIYWSPGDKSGGLDTSGSTKRPSYIGLGHEMGHAIDDNRGIINMRNWFMIGTTSIPNAEKFSGHIENQLRAEHGLNLREFYGVQAGQGPYLIPGTRTSPHYMNHGTPFRY